jgi:dihydrofolate reductase
MPQDFVTDIKTLRERARKHIENGAVTEGYKADRTIVIKLLQEALATEIVCVLRYKRHYFMAQGIHAEDPTLLLGRATWQHFTTIWPSRTDEFSTKMNRILKLVASRSLDRVDEWDNSTLVRGDLVEEVMRRKAAQDVVVMGSRSVVQTLMAHDLVDEYRLLVFPTVLGEGSRLFDDHVAPVELELAAAEPVGPAVFMVYRRGLRSADHTHTGGA